MKSLIILIIFNVLPLLTPKRTIPSFKQFISSLCPRQWSTWSEAWTRRYAVSFSQTGEIQYFFFGGARKIFFSGGVDSFFCFSGGMKNHFFPGGVRNTFFWWCEEDFFSGSTVHDRLECLSPFACFISIILFFKPNGQFLV